MLDLIKMDLYRMFKMKSLKVIMLIYAFYVLIITVSDDMQTVSESIISMFGTGLVMLFTGLFAVLFITFDSHSGFIKSYLGQLPSRTYRLVSKLVCCGVFQIFFFAYIFLAQVIANALLMDSFKMGKVSELMEFLFAAFILHYAEICVLLMISVFVKAQVLPIVMSICISLGTIKAVMYLVYAGFRNVLDIDFNPARYTITYQLDLLCDKYYATYSMFSLMDDDPYSLSKLIVISCVYIIVSIAISIAVFRKKDVA